MIEGEKVKACIHFTNLDIYTAIASIDLISKSQFKLFLINVGGASTGLKT